MDNRHESFLDPFFKEMHNKFRGNWCVLHSYETLPHYSISDVDMAFSHSNVKKLEKLIFEVAAKNGWLILQKLWYDIESCFYFVLKNKSEDCYLALDFLIDNNGYGKYGFKSSILTSDCLLISDFIAVPRHEVAFSYKFTKRIVKNQTLEKEVDYFKFHYSLADKRKLHDLFTNSFSVKGLSIINKYIENNNYSFTKTDLLILRNIRKKVQFKNTNYVKKVFYKFKRILTRILYPSGVVITVPVKEYYQLNLFMQSLVNKLDITFRFIVINNKNLIIKNVKGLSGSTLVINENNNNNKGLIVWGWFKRKEIQLNIDEYSNVENLSNRYKEEIIELLEKRVTSRYI